jgi:pyrroloquinoline-quinone synthase
MHDGATEPSGEILTLVDQILAESGILAGDYFRLLCGDGMSRQQFLRTQRQFYFAVDFFSRPMSALLVRLPCPQQRLGILANVVEEHGEFQRSGFHESTFRAFLAALGDSADPQPSEIEPPAHAFNLAIMAACNFDQIQVGIACLGMIEYAFADISALIGRAVIDRGWLAADQMVHYSLHAELDKKHAADFFQLLDSDWRDDALRARIHRGLRLGAYLFDRLYRDLLLAAGSE